MNDPKDHLERLETLTMGATQIWPKDADAIAWAVQTIEELRARIAELEAELIATNEKWREEFRDLSARAGSNVQGVQLALAGERKARESAEQKMAQLERITNGLISKDLDSSEVARLKVVEQAEEIRLLREALREIEQKDPAERTYRNEDACDMAGVARRALKSKP